MAKFAKGGPKPANSGRRKGTPNQGTTRARRLIADGADKKIVDKVVNDAQAGDIDARRLYFRYLRPAPSRSETFIGPIDYQAPKTVEDARVRILELGERLARHEISLEAHDSLIGGIKAFLGDRAVEQQRMLDRLENDLRAGKEA
jgi:hypothetical protein